MASKTHFHLKAFFSGCFSLYCLSVLFCFPENEEENILWNLINAESQAGLFWVDASTVIFCTENLIKISFDGK